MYTSLLKVVIISGIIVMNGANAQQPDEAAVPGRYQDFNDFETAPLPFKKGEIALVDDAGRVSWSKNVLLKSVEKDALGYEHYRYQQTYNNIPVEHATCVVHVKDGNKVIAENGKVVKDFSPVLAARAVITKANALSVALNNIGAREYKWQIPAEEAFLKEERSNTSATYYPEGELVYYSGDNDVIPSALQLAYKFDIYAHYPLSRYMVFIDATAGRLLGKRSLIADCGPASENVETSCDENFTVVKQEPFTPNNSILSVAYTGYSGPQNIVSYQTSPYSYILREFNGGRNIQTWNMKNAGTDFSAAVDFFNVNNIWVRSNTDLDRYAFDAHWGAEKTYDYFKYKFGRNSIDNNGFVLKNYVHADLVAQGLSSNKNARWDGHRASYGDGAVIGDNIYTPCTSLDIVGHELTHGLIQFTSDLVYAYEPGALSEGFSDIFGTCIEFFSKPAAKANWQFAENVGPSWRDLSNPNIRSCADTYKGYLWKVGEGDYGGVHNNSGVLDFWFYLLVNGGTGTNDHGRKYSVSGIGMDKAAAIAYRINTCYLISTSGFNDARKYGIKAAEDLYGKGSKEAIQTRNAWAAVGLETVIIKMADLNTIDKDANILTATPLKVFPNPVIDNKINIEIENESNATEQLVVTDATGKIVFTKNVNLSKGLNKIPVQLPGLKSGVYLIKANNKIVKLVIQ